MKKALDQIKDQVGSCGILCHSCPLGNGTIAETAGQTKEFIRECQIPVWPDSQEVDWDQVIRGLDWMAEHALCPGCEMGGGPPTCPIRACAEEKGYQLCSFCEELDSCAKFDWLEGSEQIKEKLKENRGKIKEEYIRSGGSSMAEEE